MRGINVQLIALWLVIASLARAEELRPVPVPSPAPLATAQAVPRDANHDKPDLSVDHLLKAAEHLEAAGLSDEATKLRSIARQRALHDSDLSRKEAELECLQEEVDRLRTLTGQTPGVIIEFVALEVQRSKLGLKSQEFDKMIGLAPITPHGIESSSDTGATNVLEANPTRLPLFRELREKGVIRILAEPTIATTSRRPTNYLVGGQFPIPIPSTGGNPTVGYKSFGTQIEVVASVLANQHVRLQTVFEMSEVTQNDAVVVEGVKIPGITTRRINTEVEMRLGQTLTIGRLLSLRSEATPANPPADPKRSPSGEKSEARSEELMETLIFITPRLMHEPAAVQQSTVIPAAVLDDAGNIQPADGSVFGPTVPVLKRRPAKR